MSTASATIGTGDPAQSCQSSGAHANTVWYRYYAATAGQLTVDTIGSNYDTVLSVYTGNCSAGLYEVPGGCDDDGSGTQSMVTITTAANTSYYIMVASYTAGGGQLSLHSSFTGGGGGCTYSINPTSNASGVAAGGSGSVAVSITAGTGCT